MYDHTFGVDRDVRKDELYLTIAGKSFPIVNYNIQYDLDGQGTISAEAIMLPDFEPNKHTEIEMNTTSSELLHNILEEHDMSYQKYDNVQTNVDPGSDSSLAQEYNNLQLDDSRQKLVKQRLMYSDGTLTERGKDFLLNYIARENEDDLAEAIEEIEEARKSGNCNDC